VNTDIIIEGTDDSEKGFVWNVMDTDCMDDSVGKVDIGNVKYNESTYKREFPFKTQRQPSGGIECKVLFEFIQIGETYPESIRDVKSFVFMLL